MEWKQAQPCASICAVFDNLLVQKRKEIDRVIIMIAVYEPLILPFKT